MPIPDHIGRFAVRQRIGGGAFASVWLAHDDAFDSLVAIKVLAENWLDSMDVRGRFVAEARLLRRAESDHVVRVHDIGELPDGRPYLVMTYGDRGTLSDRLTAGPLPWRDAVTVAIQVGEALHALHQHGVLHRDIKPSNVLFRSRPDGQDQVMLGDLGLGKLLSEASGLTMAGGTPGYMAPEQARLGAAVSVRTDVYGLGALLYRTVTGRHPHDLTEFAEIADPKRPSPRAPSTIVADIPSELDSVLARALATDSDDRHADAAELVAELRLLAAGSGGTLIAEPAARRAGRRRAWLLIAVPVALAGIGLGAVWYLARPTGFEASDDTRTIRLRVRAEWAEEITGAGWNPESLGLPSGHQPGLVVATSVPKFPDRGDSEPGVFAGVLPATSALAADVFRDRVVRPDCTAVTSADISTPAVRAARRQQCGTTFVDDVLVETAGRQIWVQIKQPVDDASVTQEVLRSVSVGP